MFFIFIELFLVMRNQIKLVFNIFRCLCLSYLKNPLETFLLKTCSICMKMNFTEPHFHMRKCFETRLIFKGQKLLINFNLCFMGKQLSSWSSDFPFYANQLTWTLEKFIISYFVFLDVLCGWRSTQSKTGENFQNIFQACWKLNSKLMSRMSTKSLPKWLKEDTDTQVITAIFIDNCLGCKCFEVAYHRSFIIMG